MFNTAAYTFSPIKVVWGNIASRIEAAVLESPTERPVIPQHTITLVAIDSSEEAHSFCAMVNSSLFDFAVRSYSEEGGKSFGTPRVLETVRVPRFDRSDYRDVRLAELSRQAHRVASGSELITSLESIEREVDWTAAQVWGLTEEELDATRRGLEE